MRPISIYDLPPLYDRIVPPGPCESFYRALARRVGGAVLELACGSGRLTIPLAQDGHEVIGLDRSPAMLNAARAKARAMDVPAAFLVGDMRRFAFGRRFGLVVLACNSLAHLTENDEVIACLSCVREHLDRDGVLAFDIVNPDLARLAAHRTDLRFDAPDGLTVQETAAYDPVGQIRTACWTLRQADLEAAPLAPLVLRHFFPQEVGFMLRAAGLRLAARHGDFAGGPFAADSANQICIATRA